MSSLPASAPARSDHDGDGDGVRSRKYLLTLTIGALGVVYGDIGTSPLYAFRESLRPESGVLVTTGNVLGVLSLITWSLILVIAVKYLVFVMRASLNGEGGILALTALVRPPKKDGGRTNSRHLLIMIGLFGTALLYGDGMITPAISVLAAVEGFEVATDVVQPFVIPVAIVILIGLFSVQSRGTGAVGAVFGRVMFVWFIVLAVLGISGIIADPAVLAAVNPIHGVRFFVDNGFPGFLVLGSVFLVVTGGEALYADMGHFGRKPIALGWFAFVLPALLLNYYGQGGLLLEQPGAIENPFYLLAPGWATVPLALLATCATVIASQALISGAFSLTLQAVQLGYLPRVKITQTSEEEAGQIYIASINRILMVACIGLVLGFRSSSNLAAAYGVAVTATMVVTTLLFYVVARERFGWSRLRAGSLCGLFAVFDLGFFAANLFKIPDGGWFPLIVGLLVFTIMTTWKHGRQLVVDAVRDGELGLPKLIASLDGKVERVGGTAVYLYSRAGKAPPALLSNLRHQGALHENVVCVTVKQASRPHVPLARRVQVESYGQGFSQVVLIYGYRDEICVPDALRSIVGKDLHVDPERATYIVGRERVLATDRPGMALWRERLFAIMLRNSTDIVSFFSLPTDRVIEVGRAVEI